MSSSSLLSDWDFIFAQSISDLENGCLNPMKGLAVWECLGYNYTKVQHKHVEGRIKKSWIWWQHLPHHL